MTSQRFLNDKVNSKDFLRSLKSACLAPIIMAVVLSIKFLGSTISFVTKLSKNPSLIEAIQKKELISFFGNVESDFDYLPFAVLMIIGGIYMAFTLFSFMFKKNSVNVYFSMGITRSRLYLNRIVASILEIFAASFLPFLIVFIINATKFGYHSHQLALLGFNTFWMFVSGVSGFAIGTFAATVSGSAIETALTSLALSLVGVIGCSIFNLLRKIFLLGYVSDYSRESSLQSLFTPWNCLGFNHHHTLNAVVQGKKLTEEQIITWGNDILPAFIWVAVSIILLAFGFLLINKRKNENAHSFGKFYISSVLCGAMVFTVVLDIALEILYGNLSIVTNIFIWALLILAGTFIAFFLAELIMRRNIKGVIRTLPVYAALAVVTLLGVTVVDTEYFGTYNKLPDIKDIESVAFSYDDPYGMLSAYPAIYVAESYYKTNEKKDDTISSDPQDISLCVDYFNKIKKDKRKGNEDANVTYESFLIKTKDGKFISRYFPVYTESLSREYNRAVFNSDYFHKILKKVLLSTEDLSFSGTAGTVYEQIYDYGYNEIYYYFGKTLIADERALDSENGFYAGDELKTALYNDLCKITYDEYYSQDYTGALVTEVSFANKIDEKYYIYAGRYLAFDGGYGNTVDENGVPVESDNMGNMVTMPYCEIMILPQMTETLKLLEGVEQLNCEKTVKSVIYPTESMSLDDAIKKVLGCNTYYADIFVSANYTQTGIWTNNKKIGKVFGTKEQGTYKDFIETIYSAAGTELKTVDDAEKVKQIDEKSVVIYDTSGDKGGFVFAVYDDGSVVPKYIPEKAVSVLK